MTAEMLSTAELLEAIQPAPERMADADLEREDQRQAVLTVAAPLHLFRPSQLQGGGGDEPAPLIINDIVPAVGWSAEGLWTLKTDVRREVLGLVPSRGALAALRDLNRDVQLTPVQVLLDRWLKGETLEPSEMDATDLAALRVLLDWGLERFQGFPNASSVERSWLRRSLVADFEHLAKGFVGRQPELERLRAFANAAGLDGRGRCLMLYGSGGVGKSALVARFILDFFDRTGADYVPFAYLALDDPTLDPARPMTLVGAALRQLETQWSWLPLAGDPFADYRSLEQEASRTRRGRSTRGSIERSQRAKLAGYNALDVQLTKAFALGLERISEAAGPSGRPLLLVIDTFEEASYRPEPDLRQLYDLLELLVAMVPAIRILLIGRTRPTGDAFEGLGAEDLPLLDLPEPDAVKLLRSEGFDKATAVSAVKSFGRNPLTLRLLGHALRGAALDAPGQSLALAGEEVVRGYLYRRILDHIHDPTVRRLAHPGMVLRRVTPEIIEKVLAPACGVYLELPGDAERLFDQLAREHTLVSRAADGALVYREEIRLPMLKLIEADAPDEVKSLHRSAASYYSRKDDEASREEELYHRLMLPDLDSGRLDRNRFLPMVASRLAVAVDEFPAASQIALAQLTRVRIDPALYDQADREHADSIAARDILYHLRTGDFEDALRILDRPIVPGSVLAPLKVRVLRELGKTDEAQAFADEQVSAFPPLGNRARLAQLMWFAAQASPGNERTEYWLRRLVPLTKRLSALALVQVLTELWRVVSPAQASLVGEELANALARLSESDAYREDRMVRLALARMGPRNPQTWRRLAPDLVYGLPSTLMERSADELEKLARAIADLLDGSDDPMVKDVVASIREEPSRSEWIGRVVGMLYEALRDAEPDLRMIGTAHLLILAERTSLSASSLAGFTDEEQDWSPDAPSEALA